MLICVIALKKKNKKLQKEIIPKKEEKIDIKDGSLDYEDID